MAHNTQPIVLTSPFLTVKEAAEYLRVRPKTISDWIYRRHETRIPVRWHGARVVFHKDDLMKWSQERVGV